MSPRGPFCGPQRARARAACRWMIMTVYRTLGTAVGTREAVDLAHRLVAWHDAMVRHRRRTADAVEACEGDCPHSQAASLWREAVEVYGARATEFAFLRSVGGAAAQPADAVEELPYWC